MAILSLHVEKPAWDFLTTLPPKQFKQVHLAIYRLASNPSQHDSEALKGEKFAGLWRNDVGEYRIIYRYDDAFLRIVAIGNRNDNAVYKALNRKI